MIPAWYWAAALAFTALILFGVPEYIALRFGGETFSRFMRNASDVPIWGKLWMFLWGGLIFGLLVHFNGWCVYDNSTPLGFGSSYIHGDATSEKKVGK